MNRRCRNRTKRFRQRPEKPDTSYNESCHCLYAVAAFLCYFAGVLDAGCKKGRRYVILKAVQGHMINMALFYHVYEVGVKDS